MNTQRPLSVAIAAILLALLSLPNLIFPLLPSEGVPAFIIYSNVVWGVAGLVAAAGLWMLKRWSMWLTIVLCVLGILSAAPGIGGAPTTFLQVLATTGVVGSALIILLVVLPNSRRAYA
jgi:peptidoglycan/LPS O-acetylase OafA/YrhL